MDFIYCYGIVLFFAISTVLSLLLVQQNTIFIKNNNISKALYLFLYIAFTYNIVSLSRNFLTNITLYYIPLLFMLSFLSYRFIILGGILTPLIVSVYFSFWYPNYTMDLVIKLLLAGTIGIIPLLLIRRLIKPKLLMYLSASFVMACIEIYQNSLMIKGTIFSYGSIQVGLTMINNLLLGLFVYYASKIIHAKIKEIQLKLASYDRDDLTGLYNFRQLNQDVLKVEPNDTQELTIIIIDIDHFKKLNDTHGHSHGNEILKFVADTVKRMITAKFTRNQYRIYRYGGEEIVVVLEDHIPQVDQILRELKTLISNESLRLYNENLTLSIGVSFNKKHHFDNLEAFRQADQLLYQVKTEGRDNYLIEN
ncbi:GGDEF domain-containing protein [Periweissella beninensis]|uniref:GGDEF domain-containing protein n=1 Tax=Periweissella beninensis TaxID=504936 RepID=UPI0021A3BDAF|nr:GGDEF domain-containing protein [Periweissella beninensis]MCT4396672.1 GGDEF domain-containing protein [Periweissella beninensis]